MIKVILILSLFLTPIISLHAKEINLTQEISTGLCDIEIIKQSGTSSKRALSVKYQNNFDITNDQWYFQSTLFVYKNESKEPSINSNFKKPFKDQDLYFKSLYISYTEDKHTFGTGILSLSDNANKSFLEDMIKRGEGIYVMSDIDYPGVFYKYTKDNYSLTFIISDTDWYKDIPLGKYYPEHVEFNGEVFLYNSTNGNISNIIEIAHTVPETSYETMGDAYGIGYSFTRDGSYIDGFSWYGTVAMSYVQRDYFNPQALIDDGSLNPILLQLYPEAFAFQQETYIGYATDVGFRHDIELFNHEVWYGFEYYRRYKDWTSANYGASHLGKCEKTFNAKDALKIAVGLRIDKSSDIIFSHEDKSYDGSSATGFNGKLVHSDLYDDTLSKDITKVVYIYRF